MWTGPMSSPTTLCGLIVGSHNELAEHERECPICIKALKEAGDKVQEIPPGLHPSFTDEYLDWEDPTNG